ncbi:glutathione peroxidase [Legionella quinlivanii]|uniref:Glutathione peroxidase n=1 Tax=Legionella quinlivanii TaxID=45073 RepID=A0A364LFM2_9GAMM|nr:glutathione peroxidase [Legionella quinlivanii]RAP34737.1 glutathione peroxidase [Legionella quinlivanii]
MTISTHDNAYHYSFHQLAGGQELPLANFKGKVLVIVNTASKCGFTPQYTGLEKLYQDYKDRGLVIIGVPSNDFGKQEPGTEDEIGQFCQINYGVTFPMTGKEVVSGKNAHPFFQWAHKTLGFGSAPKWNFHKYLINRNGELVTYFFSTTAPDSTRFINAIEKELDSGSDNSSQN